MQQATWGDKAVVCSLDDIHNDLQPAGRLG
jgi:hypothetical protein